MSGGWAATDPLTKRAAAITIMRTIVSSAILSEGVLDHEEAVLGHPSPAALLLLRLCEWSRCQDLLSSPILLWTSPCRRGPFLYKLSIDHRGRLAGIPFTSVLDPTHTILPLSRCPF